MVAARTKGPVLETVCHVAVEAHEQTVVGGSNDALIGSGEATISPYVAPDMTAVSTCGGCRSVSEQDRDVLGQPEV